MDQTILRTVGVILLQHADDVVVSGGKINFTPYR